MKKLLLIFAIILTAISANAQQQVKEGKTKYDQLQTNDIVTISRESGGNRTYFTVENNAIAAHNEPNVNSLWRIVYCAYQKFDWGDQNIYQFQHVNSGKYLRVDASGITNNRYNVRLYYQEYKSTTNYLIYAYQKPLHFVDKSQTLVNLPCNLLCPIL